MIENHNQLCTGCRACEQLCPTHCISMIKDIEGFAFPQVDVNKCINCDLCNKRCPINAGYTSNDQLDESVVYAAKNKNDDILMNSSSGGMFSVLADYVLQRKGAVVGCAFNDNLVAEHIIIEKELDLDKLRGSKYVQSDIKDTYIKAEVLLKTGCLLLYTGTPCQIAGLKAFLNKEYDNLFTADLICHGVPSPKIFSAYIKSLESRYRGNVTAYYFRDKSKSGWGLNTRFTVNSITRKRGCELETYYYAFLKSYLFRECCYNCKYATTKRQGDFTIADYWGVEHYHSEIPRHDGVSLLLVNSEKANRIFEEINHKIMSIPSKLEYAIRENGNLKCPSARPPIRDIIYKDYNKYGYRTVAKKYMKPKNYFISYTKYLIPENVKTRIKSMLKLK